MPLIGDALGNAGLFASRGLKAGAYALDFALLLRYGDDAADVVEAAARVIKHGDEVVEEIVFVRPAEDLRHLCGVRKTGTTISTGG